MIPRVRLPPFLPIKSSIFTFSLRKLDAIHGYNTVKNRKGGEYKGCWFSIQSSSVVRHATLRYTVIDNQSLGAVTAPRQQVLWCRLAHDFTDFCVPLLSCFQFFVVSMELTVCSRFVYAQCFFASAGPRGAWVTAVCRVQSASEDDVRGWASGREEEGSIGFWELPLQRYNNLLSSRG